MSDYTMYEKSTTRPCRGGMNRKETEKKIKENKGGKANLRHEERNKNDLRAVLIFGY